MRNLHDAGSSLRPGTRSDLLEFVDNRSRDTILLVYGDHLPALNDVYAQLGFRDERRPEEQPVPWLLVDNRSRESRVAERSGLVAADLLIEKTGLATSQYFSTLTDLGFSDADSRLPFDVLQVLASLQFDWPARAASTRPRPEPSSSDSYRPGRRIDGRRPPVHPILYTRYRESRWVRPWP